VAATARARTRPPAKPKRTPLPPAGDDEEVIDLGDPDAEAPPPERVPLFSIGGTVHTMLKEPPLSIALSALELQRQHDDGTPEGRTEARGYSTVYMMREALGESSYRALLNCKTLTGPQFARIQDKVMKRVMGALEGEDGFPNR
jgi:hypothetical protein